MNEKNKKVQEDEIDLLELALVLLNRWKLLLIALLIGALLGGGAAYLKKDTFRSDSMIFVLSNENDSTSMSDLQVGSTISKDFVAIAKSKPVLDATIDKLEEKDGIKLSREVVAKMLSVENMADTRIIKFSIVSEDAKLSCDLCNAIADTMIDQIATIMKSDKPTLVEEAEIPDRPVGKGLRKFAAMGGMLALLIAALSVAIPYLMDDRILDEEDVEKYLETSVLAIIPYDKAQEYHMNQNQGNHKRKKHNKKKSGR